VGLGGVKLSGGELRSRGTRVFYLSKGNREGVFVKV
jgi:hypothetical protein